MDAQSSRPEACPLPGFPGRIELLPDGRLKVEEPRSPIEDRRRERARRAGPPTAKQVKCWQALREWEEAEADIDVSTMHSVEELLRLERANEAGAQFVQLVRDIDTHLAGDMFVGKVSLRLALLCSFVLWVVKIQGHTALVGTLTVLAKLLGCCKKTAWSTVQEAIKRKLLHRIPLHRRVPEGWRCREGDVRDKRRHSNALELGPALTLLWHKLGIAITPEWGAHIAEMNRTVEQIAARIEATETAPPSVAEDKDRKIHDPTAVGDLNSEKTRGPVSDLSTAPVARQVVYHRGAVDADAFASARTWLTATPPDSTGPRCDLDNAADRSKWFHVARKKASQADSPTKAHFWAAVRLVLVQAQDGTMQAAPEPEANRDRSPEPAAAPEAAPAPTAAVAGPGPRSEPEKFMAACWTNIGAGYLAAYWATEGNPAERQALIDWAELRAIHGATMEDIGREALDWLATRRALR